MFRIPVFLLISFLTCKFGFAVSATTLFDQPGLLEFVLDNSDIRLDSSGKWSELHCEFCGSSDVAGSPALPIWSGLIISGKNVPVVSQTVLESDKIPIRKPLKPVADHSHPYKPVYTVNSELYAKPPSPPPLSNSGMARGLTVRNINIRLAEYHHSKNELRIFKKVKVRVRFPRPLSLPSKIHIPNNFMQSFLNPNGGRYLITAPSAPLPKRSARAHKALSLPSKLIRIRIGQNKAVQQSLEGMYELSYSTILSGDFDAAFKQSISGVPVEIIQLFTNPLFLSEKVSGPPVSGRLREVPIQILDNNNNLTFDKGDAIRFYGHGTGYWRLNRQVSPGDSPPAQYQWETNPYSFYHNYYLGFSEKGEKGSRLKHLKSSAENTAIRESSWHYLRAEEDKMLGLCNSYSDELDQETGKEWYWHIIDPGICQSKSIKTLTIKGKLIPVPGNKLPGYTNEYPLFVKIQTSPNKTSDDFDVFLPGGEFKYVKNFRWDGSVYRYDGTVNPDPFLLKEIRWSANHEHIGFDGYSVIYRREHKYIDKPFGIFPDTFGKSVTYLLKSVPSGLSGLKISDGMAEGFLSRLSDGRFSDIAEIRDRTKYFFYRPKDIMRVSKEQLFFEEIQSSGKAMNNLATGGGAKPEYLIVTPRAFLEPALALKAHRETSPLHPLKTSVVLAEDIYRRYGGGQPSPVAIRDFIRWAYYGFKNSDIPDSSLKYVLLFGDGHYNYRNISMPVSYGSNHIPPYEKETHCTDDFFGYMDSSNTSNTGDYDSIIDIAIGRIPVNTPEQAGGYVEKVKTYEAPSKASWWRNIVISAADDNYQRGKIESLNHIASANLIKNTILEKDGDKITEDVFLSNYPANFAFAKPGAAQDLMNKINRGALVVNYFGHGSYDVWADEGLLVLDKALNQLSNAGKNSMFNSWSCTVGRFDKVSADCISESFVRLPVYGAIAAISATRLSYSNKNTNLAQKFYNYVFTKNPQGLYSTIGESLLRSKWMLTATIANNERYGILGEPVLMLKRPELQITLKGLPKTIQSLDCGSFEGNVGGGSGRGKIFIGVYGESRVKVFPDRSEGGVTIPEQRTVIPGETLFSTVVPYRNGKFRAEYIFTERLPMGDTNAVIRAVAWDENRLMEGAWTRSGISISGQSNCKIQDNQGPKIVITGCNRSQTSMVEFPEKIKLVIPYCIEIVIIDSTGGISAANKPDEGTVVEIERQVDGEIKSFQSPRHPSLNEDGFKRKSFRLDLDKKFLPGKYLLKVRAQDGFGNVSVKNQSITVVTDSLFYIYKVFTAPNPIKDRGACFYFGEIAKQGSGEFYVKTADIKSDIRIYNQSGHLVRRLKDVSPRTSTDGYSEQSCKTRNAWWDAKDAWGNSLGNGPYFYQVQVKRSDPGNPDATQTDSKNGVLVISR